MYWQNDDLKNLEDAHKTINNLVAAKLDAGFRFVENWEKQSEFSELVDKKVAEAGYGYEEMYGYEEEKVLELQEAENFAEKEDQDSSSLPKLPAKRKNSLKSLSPLLNVCRFLQSYQRQVFLERF